MAFVDAEIFHCLAQNRVRLDDENLVVDFALAAENRRDVAEVAQQASGSPFLFVLRDEKVGVYVVDRQARFGIDICGSRADYYAGHKEIPFRGIFTEKTSDVDYFALLFAFGAHIGFEGGITV